MYHSNSEDSALDQQCNVAPQHRGGHGNQFLTHQQPRCRHPVCQHFTATSPTVARTSPDFRLKTLGAALRTKSNTTRHGQIHPATHPQATQRTTHCQFHSWKPSSSLKQHHTPVHTFNSPQAILLRPKTNVSVVFQSRDVSCVHTQRPQIIKTSAIRSNVSASVRNP